MFPTKNHLPEDTRRNLTELLQKRLADGVDLMLQARQAHWNVKGPHFVALQSLFHLISEELERDTDLLAERIAQCGGIAAVGCRFVASTTSMAEIPSGVTNERELMDLVSRALAELAALFREDIQRVETWQDTVTAHLLTDILGRIEQRLREVEGHAFGWERPPRTTAGAESAA